MRLGINCTELCILGRDDMLRVVDDIARFGFKDVRVEVPWRLVEQGNNQWTWGSTYYAELGITVAGVEATRDALRARGLTMLPVLGVHNPSWTFTPDDVKDFATQAAKVLYAPEYELWNEVNIHNFIPFGDPKVYAPWYTAARAGIKSVSPSAKITTAGLAAAKTYTGVTFQWWPPGLIWFGNKSPEDFLTGALAAGVKDFDYVGYHPYVLGDDFSTQETPRVDHPMIKRISTVAELTKREPRLTEWGYDYAKTSPAQAAQWFKLQLPMLAPYKSYFYCWRDWSAYKFGLVDANNQPRREIYDAVKLAVASQ